MRVWTGCSRGSCCINTRHTAAQLFLFGLSGLGGEKHWGNVHSIWQEHTLWAASGSQLQLQNLSKFSIPKACWYSGTCFLFPERLTLGLSYQSSLKLAAPVPCHIKLWTEVSDLRHVMSVTAEEGSTRENFGPCCSTSKFNLPFMILLISLETSHSLVHWLWIRKSAN